MKYAELDTAAKEHALEQWRDGMVDYDWHEHVYEDAVQAGARLGIEIDNNVSRTVGGKPVSSPDISYTGFYSQGDGASYSATLHVKRFKGCREALGAYIGNLDTGHDLWSVATKAEEIYEAIVVHSVANRLSDEDSREYTECEPDMTIRVTDRYSRDSICAEGDNLPYDIETKVGLFAEDFAAWIYKQLEAEYEHYNSDEATLESIQANEPDFDEDGNIV